MQNKLINIETSTEVVSVDVLCINSRWGVHETIYEKNNYTLTHLPSHIAIYRFFKDPQTAIKVALNIDSLYSKTNPWNNSDLTELINSPDMELVKSFLPKKCKQERSMTSLLEKLKAAKAQNEQNANENQDSDLFSKLRKLGQETGINPPKPELIEESFLPEQEQEQEQEQNDDRKICPYCSKSFKVLGRHKCDQAPRISESTKETEAGSFKDGYTLLIDALIEKQDFKKVILFSDLIKPMCEAVAKENQVVAWNVVDYAKGVGFLADKLERYFQENELIGVVLASSSTPEYKACAEILKSHAMVIIKGVI